MSEMIKPVVLQRDNGKTYATITYNQDKKWLFINWEGFLTVDMVKDGSNELLRRGYSKNISQ